MEVINNHQIEYQNIFSFVCLFVRPVTMAPSVQDCSICLLFPFIRYSSDILLQRYRFTKAVFLMSSTPYPEHSQDALHSPVKMNGCSKPTQCTTVNSITANANGIMVFSKTPLLVHKCDYMSRCIQGKFKVK